ncbi:DUF5361 domain-containing protein [Nesterenkonia massiliensis]|uniref:DUF5361 domain-containing protein n=1 Tax=Nesterenkonia massiliensis TaxID=1232429 RepID=A0ABT2HR47_9MICC|nr:DUF5361 domain-containing protein [Nesterenkonia massiliensis]MCT1607154.1 DUF5361 domain-containing protein [Nesterenkonia massiliensis]
MWLCSLSSRELSAIEADLVRAGWTFDDVPARLSYPALFAFIEHLPPDSAFSRVQDPETATWTTGVIVPNLLAELGYRLDVLVWQQSKDGEHNRRRPQPWERPWAKNKNTRRIGAGPIPASRWEAFWDGGK